MSRLEPAHVPRDVTSYMHILITWEWWWRRAPKLRIRRRSNINGVTTSDIYSPCYYCGLYPRRIRNRAGPQRLWWGQKSESERIHGSSRKPAGVIRVNINLAEKNRCGRRHNSFPPCPQERFIFVRLSVPCFLFYLILFLLIYLFHSSKKRGMVSYHNHPLGHNKRRRTLMTKTTLATRVAPRVPVSPSRAAPIVKW
jgi:hypothetical protein